MCRIPSTADRTPPRALAISMKHGAGLIDEAGRDIDSRLRHCYRQTCHEDSALNKAASLAARLAASASLAALLARIFYLMSTD